ncbi:VPS41 protein [Coccidioides immitis RMSCC 3703]|uniref:VPS41 protein n=1 Tax=Coccidioides immitis RMSCC 3703 TaxID=454286 RepID=A0A0J8U099_COCIT|nr:VPS41 protein [Coccidioides immitis RMSCC 3703]
MADDAILPEAGDSKSASSPSSSARERQAEQDNNHRSEEEYDDDDDEEEEEEEDEEESDGEDEDEEPRLKYVSFTKSISPVYRNGDATSSFLVGGDKMIVGTHNGNIVCTRSSPHLVFDASTFQRFRVYHAHSASVTSVSMSPFPPPLSSNTSGKNASLADSSSRASVDLSKSPGQSRQTTVPHSPSNAIYIATSSIDGNVCVSSLLDPKDVLLRNFGRPVQAVALSPDYKSDKTYLSGGLAGDLVLTVGGRVGTSSNSTTMAGATASPSGWFGALGFGGNNGKDTVLHSGEGSISAIKWSLSGKYIVWVNEEGIKIMRSHLHLDNADSDFAWKRMNHVDRPRGPQWDEMAGVWKPRAEWIDEDTCPGGPGTSEFHIGQLKLDHRERLVVGWGGTIWVINVFPPGRDKDPRKNVIGSAEVVAILRTDCIVSGVSLYNPNVLLVLSYVASEDDGKSKRKQVGPTRGVRHRQNGLEPEIRLIDIETKEELSVDTLTMRRYESLSASDYHLGALPPAKILDTPIRRGTFETIGTGILDATLYPTRLFSSASSVRSATSSGDRRSSLKPSSLADAPVADHDSKELAILASEGIKVFIHSPYDCVVAVKRDVKDRLSWLKDHEKYEEAWELLQQHPEAVAQDIDEGESPLSTPKQRRGSVIGLFSEPVDRADNIKLEKERQNVGESWLEQLISNNNWEKAGDVCGKVLTTTPKWEHWIWIFAKNNKFDEIISHGTTPIRGHHRTSAADKLVADEGRLLIDAFADTVVELFADYDRPLLMDFLQSNTSYSYNAACATCELRHFTPELIYLFSKTGQTKRALHLILSDLRDVSHAISFAKSQDDPDLWEDLLSYSMDKPEYIRCLLVEAGTAIDPITLVKRIPSGLEIQGLREGLTRMIREHDIQASISQGVAKVLAGEVSMRMDTLRKGQRRGIKFDIVPNEEAKPTSAGSQHNEPKEELDAKGNVESSEKKQTFEPGRCAGCHSKFIEQEKEPLVGFACGHVYHLSHLHLTPWSHSSGEGHSQLEPSQSTLYEDSSPLLSRTVGLKVTNARLLREKIGDGCQICASKRVTQGQ